MKIERISRKYRENIEKISSAYWILNVIEQNGIKMKEIETMSDKNELNWDLSSKIIKKQRILSKFQGNSSKNQDIRSKTQNISSNFQDIASNFSDIPLKFQVNCFKTSRTLSKFRLKSQKTCFFLWISIKQPTKIDKKR